MYYACNGVCLHVCVYVQYVCTYVHIYVYICLSMHGYGYTVLLKDNVANERLSLLVSRSNSHTNRESKRTELKPL